MDGRERSLHRSTVLAGGVIVRRVEMDTAITRLETTVELFAAGTIPDVAMVTELRNHCRDLRALRNGGVKP